MRGLTAADVPSQAQRIAARLAWVGATCSALHQAQRDMDATCDAAINRIGDRSAQSCRGHDEHWKEFERLCAAEQAKVTTIRAQIDDVIERDMWPRELYWGVI